MEVQDIRNVLVLAKGEFDDGQQDRDAKANEEFAKSIEALEVWLISIGALPPR